VELSPEQGRAASRVHTWLSDPSAPQVFRLFGGAGTGKTTLARYIAEGVDGEVLAAAFTGKAAYVLRTKGLPASTIHKLIYLPKGRSSQRYAELKERVEELASDDPGRPALERELAAEERNLARPAFRLNLDSPLRRARLLVVDEVSMVDRQIGTDLESFNCKILVLGDPAQLPPVYGAGYFTEGTPDVLLEEIHRQARGNPIIQMAAEIREGRLPHLGRHGESLVRTRMDAEMALEADQMLVGRNRTRQAFNHRVRQLRGHDQVLPVLGDKLVCLRNSGEQPLLNGSLWEVTEAPGRVDDGRLQLRVKDPEGMDVLCLAHHQHFTGEKLEWWQKGEAEEFDYGYALTCHKAQGSQWDHVLVYNESAAFGQDRWRWLYTAVTRAARRVTLVLPN
jgi:exodeoxyribonuclease V